MTRGHNDSLPRFSPDGRLLGFVRRGPVGRGQVYVVDAVGGEPVQVTDAPLGVSEFRWRPGSHDIVFLARVPESGRYGTIPGVTAEAEPARRILTRRYRANGVGYTTDRRTHVFVVTAPNVWAEPGSAIAAAALGSDSSHSGMTIPEARQLSTGEYDHAGLAISPDGATVLTVSARHARRDEDLCSEVWRFALGPAAEPVRVLDARSHLAVSSVGWVSADSMGFLATDVGESGRDFVARNTSAYLLDMGSGGGVRRLTDPETVDLDPSGGLSAMDGGLILAHRTIRGRVELVSIDPDRADDAIVSSILPGSLVASAHDVVGDTVIVAVQHARSSGELMLAGSEPRILTDFSAELRERGLSTPVETVFAAGDGHAVHGWILTPEGPGPHPVLLTIHGGPFAQYTVAILDEAQVYVDAGYAVVLCNPRGSAGYGQAHGRAIRQAMGTVDMTDVLDFFDGALASSDALDPARVGIMGGSYGGYLTAWTIAHDHRFAASIVERGFLDPEAFVGTSDIGDFFGEEYVGREPEQVTRQSPQAVVGRVTTPTLVLHSEQDYRCPLSQAERYYAALTRVGVPTELVIFPGENHELSRTGRPRHRLQRFEMILEWWARHLPTGANSHPDSVTATR
ncbi:prolyl oligopeptidase family serine peptidase [Cryobacterium sp. MLB-32]|uniref:S9 family peptidase n=1 Tax=Cryobacterium sp. MLB-32 TaxID=1529318 RepID=UPI00350F9066